MRRRGISFMLFFRALLSHTPSCFLYLFYGNIEGIGEGGAGAKKELKGTAPCALGMA